MKLYFLKDEGYKIGLLNLEGVVDYDSMPGAYSVRSVRAFIRKKYAKEYIKEMRLIGVEIFSINIK